MTYKRERSKRGVLVCVNKMRNGNIQLTLDDVRRGEPDASTWTLDVFITAKDLSEEQFKELKFDEKELSDFGYYILSRLHAFYEENEL